MPDVVVPAPAGVRARARAVVAKDARADWEVRVAQWAPTPQRAVVARAAPAYERGSTRRRDAAYARAAAVPVAAAGGGKKKGLRQLARAADARDVAQRPDDEALAELDAFMTKDAFGRLAPTTEDALAVAKAVDPTAKVSTAAAAFVARIVAQTGASASAAPLVARVLRGAIHTGADERVKHVASAPLALLPAPTREPLGQAGRFPARGVYGALAAAYGIPAREARSVAYREGAFVPPTPAFEHCVPLQAGGRAVVPVDWYRVSVGSGGAAHTYTYPFSKPTTPLCNFGGVWASEDGFVFPFVSHLDPRVLRYAPVRPSLAVAKNVHTQRAVISALDRIDAGYDGPGLLDIEFRDLVPLRTLLLPGYDPQFVPYPLPLPRSVWSAAVCGVPLYGGRPPDGDDGGLAAARLPKWAAWLRDAALAEDVECGGSGASCVAFASLAVVRSAYVLLVARASSSDRAGACTPAQFDRCVRDARRSVRAGPDPLATAVAVQVMAAKYAQRVRLGRGRATPRDIASTRRARAIADHGPDPASAYGSTGGIEAHSGSDGGFAFPPALEPAALLAAFLEYVRSATACVPAALSAAIEYVSSRFTSAFAPLFGGEAWRTFASFVFVHPLSVLRVMRLVVRRDVRYIGAEDGGPLPGLLFFRAESDLYSLSVDRDGNVVAHGGGPLMSVVAFIDALHGAEYVHADAGVREEAAAWYDTCYGLGRPPARMVHALVPERYGGGLRELAAHGATMATVNMLLTLLRHLQALWPAIAAVLRAPLIALGFVEPGSDASWIASVEDYLVAGARACNDPSAPAAVLYGCVRTGFKLMGAPGHERDHRMQAVVRLTCDLARVAGRRASEECVQSRPQPVVVLLIGPPGCGKSTMANMLCLGQTGSEPWMWNSASAHDDGYTGQQSVVLNEYFARTDLETVTERASKFLGWTGGEPAIMVKAALEDKGMYFQADFIVVTANNAVNTGFLACPEAFKRRVSFVVYVSGAATDTNHVYVVRADPALSTVSPPPVGWGPSAAIDAFRSGVPFNYGGVSEASRLPTGVFMSWLRNSRAKAARRYAEISARVVAEQEYVEANSLVDTYLHAMGFGVPAVLVATAVAPDRVHSAAFALMRAVSSVTPACVSAVVRPWLAAATHGVAMAYLKHCIREVQEALVGVFSTGLSRFYGACLRCRDALYACLDVYGAAALSAGAGAAFATLVSVGWTWYCARLALTACSDVQRPRARPAVVRVEPPVVRAHSQALPAYMGALRVSRGVVSFNAGFGSSTGCLLTPTALLTAAHAVTGVDTSASEARIVLPGSDEPITCGVARVAQLERSDLALVTLDAPVPGFANIMRGVSGDAGEAFLGSAGYMVHTRRGVVPLVRAPPVHGLRYPDASGVLRTVEHALCYSAGSGVVRPGDSGAPITSNGVLVGIHTAGSPSGDKAYGAYVTAAILEALAAADTSAVPHSLPAVYPGPASMPVAGALSMWNTPWVQSEYRTRFELVSRFVRVAEACDVSTADWALLKAPRACGVSLGRADALTAFKVQLNPVVPWRPGECEFAAGFLSVGANLDVAPSVPYGDLVAAAESMARSASAGLPYTALGCQTRGRAWDVHRERILIEAGECARALFARGAHVGPPCVGMQKDELGLAGKRARVLIAPPMATCIVHRAFLDPITTACYNGISSLGFNVLGSDWVSMRARFNDHAPGYRPVGSDATACDASLSPVYSHMIADVWEVLFPKLRDALEREFGSPTPFHNYFDALLTMPVVINGFVAERRTGNASGQSLTTEVNTFATAIPLARAAYDAYAREPNGDWFARGVSARVDPGGMFSTIMVYGDDMNCLLRSDVSFDMLAESAARCGQRWAVEHDGGTPPYELPWLGRVGDDARLPRGTILNMVFWGKRGDHGSVYNDRVRAALNEAARYDTAELHAVVWRVAHTVAARYRFVLACDVGLDLTYPTLRALVLHRAAHDHGPCADPRSYEGIDVSVHDLASPWDGGPVCAHFSTAHQLAGVT